MASTQWDAAVVNIMAGVAAVVPKVSVDANMDAAEEEDRKGDVVMAAVVKWKPNKQVAAVAAITPKEVAARLGESW